MDRCNRTGQQLANLNLFDTETNDEHVKRNQILSTRVYIFLLLLSLFLHTLYLSLTSQSILMAINKPKIKEYQKLQEKYSDSLQCPCERIAISYEEFINSTVRFHEICTSDFVSQRWIDYLFFENISYLHRLDFRRSAPAKFQLLRTLCQQAEIIVEDHLEELYSKKLITNNLISSDSFNLQVDAFIDVYKRNVVPSLGDTSELIRMIIINNGLSSAIETLYNWQYEFIGSIFHPELANTNKKFECYSSKGTTHLLPEGIYANITHPPYNNAITPIFRVPGMNVGCKPVESLMESTNECLFLQQCLDLVIPYMYHSSLKNSSFTILYQSLSTWNATIKKLTEGSFIEHWIVKKSYEKYFTSCQPVFCQYTVVRKRSLTEISVALITLYGGLEAVLRLIILHAITFIRRKKRQQPADANTTRIIFTVYTATEYQPQTRQFPNPKQADFERLKNMSLNGFHCSCSKITIKHSAFISFNPIYHQICSSVFASNLWNNYEGIWILDFASFIIDFRTSSGRFFSFLFSLCQSSKRTVENNLQRFSLTELVTSDVMDEDQFDHNMISLIRSFIIQTQQTFQEQTSLIENVISGNKILVGLGQQYYSEYDTSNSKKSFFPRNNTGCFCATRLACQVQVNFEDRDEPSIPLLGIYDGCYIFDSFLQSTGECFYSEACIILIKSRLRHEFELYDRVEPLQYDETSQYRINDTFEKLVMNLFIEKWNEKYSYRSYYSQCNPSHCSYTIQQRLSLIPILTTVISFYGGLKLILRILVPNLIILIRSKARQQPGKNFRFIVSDCEKNLLTDLPFLAISIFNRIHQSIQLLKTKIIHLNFFRNQSTNQEKIRQQLFSTRLYIIVFIIALIILVLYTSVKNKNHVISIKIKDLDHYERLQKQYPSTLSCPCTRIAIEHKQFIQLHPKFHPVCSSDFVNQLWFNFLHLDDDVRDHHPRSIATSQFQSLSYLCNLTKETVDNRLIEFHSGKIITNQIMPRELFKNEIRSIADSLKKSTPRTFKRTLDMTREIIHGNFFMTVLQTNWKFVVFETDGHSPLFTKPVTYRNGSCACGKSSKCTESYGNNGLLVGCYPLDSLLQSSLKCFYNRTCLESIQEAFRPGSDKNIFEVLSTDNRSSTDETVQEMVDRLFVNEWTINDSCIGKKVCLFIGFVFNACNSYRRQASLTVPLTHRNVDMYFVADKNNKHYRQIRGGAMGSAFTQLHHSIYERYIDDIFMTTDQSIEEINIELEKANNKGINIKLSTCINTSVHFLDVTVSNESGQLRTVIYHKPTTEPYVLPYTSDHPRHDYRNIPYAALLRAARICSNVEDFHSECIGIDVSLLLNKYAPGFITEQFQRFFQLSKDAYQRLHKIFLYQSTRRENKLNIMMYNPLENPLVLQSKLRNKEVIQFYNWWKRYCAFPNSPLEQLKVILTTTTNPTLD
ncbi:unnamed protein product [Adineta ricciae]|uniref:Helix-turn-helix domain-containing protein n=1 Tax=Adineta ricciae TaxID=249248 RepID=A0A815HLD2_ADIRI|nr:unnamed protein product [Adineta ricciae]